MSYFCHGVLNNNLSIMSHDQRDSNKVQTDNKKKQILIVKEGDYYCTYILDEKGNKILLNRVPLKQEEQKADKPEKSYNSNVLKNERTIFECQQRLQAESAHKENLQGMLNILQEQMGINKSSRDNE